MIKNLKLLGAVLVGQCVLAAALMVNDNSLSAKTSTEDLFKLDTRTLQKLIIEGDAGKQQVTLVRADDTWQVASLDNFRADESKIVSLLDDLEKVRSSWVVSRDAADLERFKVGDDNFERRVALVSDEDAKTVITVGTSPGFRRVHGRVDDNQAIHDLNLSSYLLNADAQNWADKDALKILGVDVKEIHFEDFTLEKDEEAWTLSGLDSEQSFDPDKASELANKLLGLTFNRISEEPVDEKATVHNIRLVKKDDTEIIYTLSKLKEGDDYRLTVSGYQQSFVLSAFDAKRLLEASKEDLLES